MALLVTYMAFGALHRIRFIFFFVVLDKGKLLLHSSLVMLVLFLWYLVIVHQAHDILSSLGVLFSTNQVAVEQVVLQTAELHGVCPNQHRACKILLLHRYLGRHTMVTFGRGHIRYQRGQFFQLGINKYLG